MSWLWSALMPHPPVMIPEVGIGRENEASKTSAGISALTSKLEGQKPEVLVIISPHQPYMPGAIFMNNAENFSGTFGIFGVPSVRIQANCAIQETKDLCVHFQNGGVKVYSGSSGDLTRDQGTMVPLYFLRKVWGDLPPVIIASPIGLTPEEAYSAGKVLASFSSTKSYALLASGDLSHRLTPDAPAGYEPEYAPVFEAAIEEALKECSPSPILKLNARTLERAGECGLRSVMMMLGLVGENGHIEIYSHEWPFGVGYCNALWLKR